MKTGWLGQETNQTLKLKKKTIIKDLEDDVEVGWNKEELEEVLFKESPF